MEIYEILRPLLGEPPIGYEWIEYVISALIVVWFIKQVLNLVEIPLKILQKGGKRE